MAWFTLTSLMRTIELEFLPPNPRLVFDSTEAVEQLHGMLAQLVAFLEESENQFSADNDETMEDWKLRVKDAALRVEDEIESQVIDICGGEEHTSRTPPPLVQRLVRSFQRVSGLDKWLLAQKFHKPLRNAIEAMGELMEFMKKRKQSMNNFIIPSPKERIVDGGGSSSINLYPKFVVPDTFNRSRSLFSFYDDGHMTRGHQMFANNFKMLRVLNLSSFSFMKDIPLHIVDLVLLRYLVLRPFKSLRTLPVSKNWNLQTLVLLASKKNTSEVGNSLISEMWDLPKLRHVQVCKTFVLDAPRMVQQSLQTIYWLHSFQCTEQVFSRFPNAKVLGIFMESLHPNCLDNLRVLVNLESLKIKSQHHSPVLLPSLEAFPIHLKKLKFKGTLLPWNAMTDIVGMLPNLQVLKLKDGACQGQEWALTGAQFHGLKSLLIYGTDLMHWTTTSDDFPVLERLILNGCYDLKEIPCGFGGVASLQLIELCHCYSSLVNCAKQIEEEQRDYGNDVLVVRNYSTRVAIYLVVFALTATFCLDGQRFIDVRAEILATLLEQTLVYWNFALALPQTRLLHDFIGVGESAVSGEVVAANALRVAVLRELYFLHHFIVRATEAHDCVPVHQHHLYALGVAPYFLEHHHQVVLGLQVLYHVIGGWSLPGGLHFTFSDPSSVNNLSFSPETPTEWVQELRVISRFPDISPWSSTRLIPANLFSMHPKVEPLLDVSAVVVPHVFPVHKRKQGVAPTPNFQDREDVGPHGQVAFVKRDLRTVPGVIRGVFCQGVQLQWGLELQGQAIVFGNAFMEHLPFKISGHLGRHEVPGIVLGNHVLGVENHVLAVREKADGPGRKVVFCAPEINGVWLCGIVVGQESSAEFKVCILESNDFEISADFLHSWGSPKQRLFG
nr:putative late blight resistance protein homolog R1B-14 [Ipomoea trifida]